MKKINNKLKSKDCKIASKWNAITGHSADKTITIKPDNHDVASKRYANINKPLPNVNFRDENFYKLILPMKLQKVKYEIEKEIKRHISEMNELIQYELDGYCSQYEAYKENNKQEFYFVDEKASDEIASDLYDELNLMDEEITRFSRKIEKISNNK